MPPILPPQDGYLLLDAAKFPASFAADVNADAAAFMADSQVPWGLDALNGAVSNPAWKTKPSWYLVSTDDRMIPLRDLWGFAIWTAGLTGSTVQWRDQTLRLSADGTILPNA